MVAPSQQSVVDPLEREEKERESRFAHVLQPIRDITKNWNIDIAAELEEYLQEVWVRGWWVGAWVRVWAVGCVWMWVWV